MTTIYMVRHMETEANISATLQGHHDTNPSEMGLQQLTWLQDRFKNTDIDVIYTSPLNRARTTAQSVKGDRDIPIIEDSRIMEIMLGDMENLKISLIESLYPEQFEALTTNLHTLSAPNGENVEQVYARMVEAIDEIAQKNDGKTIAIVSHGLAIQAYTCRLYNEDHTYINNVFLGQNTSVTKFTFESNSPTICYIGDVKHIPEEHRKKRKKYMNN